MLIESPPCSKEADEDEGDGDGGNLTFAGEDVDWVARFDFGDDER